MTDKLSVPELIQKFKVEGPRQIMYWNLPDKIIEKFERIAERRGFPIIWSSVICRFEAVYLEKQLCAYVTCEIQYQPETTPFIESKKFGIYLCHYSMVDKK